MSDAGSEFSWISIDISFVFRFPFYSILGSALFSLGSVLIWAIVRSSIPRNAALATSVGLASGYAIARLGYDYLNHVDNAVASGKKAITESAA